MEEGSLVITGATGQVGRATIDALVRRGVRPTALVRRDGQLEGSDTISDWLASDRALAAIQRASTVVHLAGTLNPPDHDYERANILPTQRIANAVNPARTRSLVFLSYVGASEESTNRYLATKARAERLLREAGVPVTVFRCTHIIGPPTSPGPTAASLLAAGGKSVTVLGNGKQRLAPVYLGDVVAAIEAAVSSKQAGTFDLQGPEEMSLDDLVRRLNGPKVSIAHVPAVVARLLRFVGAKLPGPLIDIMLKDCRSERPTAQSVFGLSLTSLDRVWSRAG
ncbi:MAG: NAD-dependent epimerase/dehydratase family protein [Candidatus Polarisedimenticolia bacterium]